MLSSRAVRPLLLAAVAWAPLSSVALAQTAGQDEPNRVDDIIVTGVPYGVRQDSTTIATTVLTEEDLAVAPAATLGDLLAATPGLRSTTFSPGASRPVIRGLTGPRVQVLTNGIGLIDASSVSPDHQVAADPAEANRIEIIRGPATLVYGGSAIGGVVNVLDGRVPEFVPDGGADGHVSAQGSSVDDGIAFSGRADVAYGPLVLHIDGMRRESEDYAIPAPAISQQLADAEGISRDETETLNNSAVEIVSYGLGGSYVGDWGYLGLSVKDVESTYGVVAEESVFIELEQQRFDARGQVNFASGPFRALQGSVGQADYTHTEFESAGEPGTVFFSDGWEGRLDLIQRQSGDWTGAVGVQGLSRTLEAVGDEAYIPSTDISEGGIYTVQRLDMGGFGFEGGLRYDQRTLAATPLGAPGEVQREFDSLSASASAFARPVEGLFVGLSVSRNERAPSEVELFADGLHIATGAYEVGNPDFDTESVVTVEGTIHYDRGPFRGDLHAYASNYDGFIDIRDTGLVFTVIEDGVPEDFPIFAYVQTGAEFRGFEAEAALDVWRDGDRIVSIEGAADYVDAETDLGPAARIPPWSATGRLVYTSGPIDAGLEVRRVGEQDDVAEFELPTDGYTLVNLSAAWRPLPAEGLTFFAELHNLGDEEAREHVSFLKDIAPLPGRNLRVGLTYRF